MGAFTQRWLEKGRQEGRQEGILLGMEQGEARGEERGRLRGLRDTVARQLTLRFGPLNAATQQKLEQASPEQLDRWADALLTASTLEEVFRLQ